LTARVGLADAQAFEAKATIRSLDPRNFGNFADLPGINLNAELSARGRRHPALEADASFRIIDSRLEGHPLTGQGQLTLRADTLHIPNLVLNAGDNRLSAEGRLAERDARITFAVDAPKLNQLGSGFGGALKLDGDVRGSVQQPRIAANWNGNALRLPGQFQIDTTHGKLEVALNRNTNAALLASIALEAEAQGTRNTTQQVKQLNARLQYASAASAPLLLAIRGEGINGQQLDAEHFEIGATGTTAQHTLNTSLVERDQDWKMTANGGLRDLVRDPGWQGSISTLQAQGRVYLRLSEPTPLRVSQRQVQFERFRIA